MKPIHRRDLLVRACSLGSLAQGASSREDAPRRRKVVVTGGHPGDPEYGCGGTIARLADLGHQVVLLYLNDGVPAGKPKDGVRVAEAGKACEILGGRPLFAGQVDGEAVIDREHCEAFRKILASESPDVVFTHWHIDDHADHRAMSMLVYDAWLSMGRRFALYYYEVSNGEDTLQFAPTHHVDITTAEPRKRRACFAHASQSPREILRLAGAGDPFPGNRVGLPACRRLHPPHPQPRLLAPARLMNRPPRHSGPSHVPASRIRHPPGATAPGSPAGSQTPRPGGQGHLLRHLQLEVRGLARLDLRRVAIPDSRQALQEEVRRGVPDRIRRDVPDRLRRLRLLPVPLGGLLGEAVRRDPPGFLFGLKVPEDITVATWPGHARYGTRAGERNGHFLGAATFERHFGRLLRPHRDRVATLIFEFGTFNKSTFPTPGDFLAVLDPFLAALPEGFRYAVEIRNPEYLIPDYLDLLASRNVAHVFNAWTRMPVLEEQVQLPDAFTADFTVVRALLRKGRAYEQAVKTFEPYRTIQEPNEGTREGMRQIAEESMRRKKPAFLFVNNRLEGNAPGTIEAVADMLA